MHYYKRLWGVSLAFITNFSSFAQTASPQSRLDSLFTQLETNNLAIGTISITKNGQPMYHRSIGKDQTAATTYRIGSITKVFTATLIYQLIEAKKLSLDDTLGRFFPGLPNANRITIAQLLGHRSGLPNFTTPAAGFDSWKYEAKTQDQLLATIASQQPDFEPGAKADYNNSNYLLLGYVLEKIYNKPYKDIVDQRIIRKLQLKNTCYGDHAGFQGNETPSYKYFDGQWQKEKAAYIANFGGAGALISTPDDLDKFITAIFDGKLISKTSIARMTHMEKDWYGWGMFSFGDSAHAGYGHGGKTEGFASSLQYYPDSKIAIAYCTSGEVYPKDDIMQLVFKLAFAEPAGIPTFKPVTLTRDQLEPLTGVYTGDNGLRIEATINNAGMLVLALKGQQFELVPLSDTEFRNIRFGFFFDFDRAARQLIVHDAAATYWLHKL